MRIVKAELSQPILLGRQGEHGVTQVVFDLSGYIKTYGDGVAQLTVKRPGDPLEYMGVLTQTGTTAVWEIGPEWTEISGQGYCYLHWHVDNDHAKPSTYKTMVQESNSACDAPEPQVGYLDQIANIGARAVRAAESAERSADEVRATAKRFDETFSGVVQTAEKNAVDAAVRAEEAAGDARGSAETAAASEQGASEHRAAAEAAREQAEGYSSHPPMIGENGNWWEWDGAAYADTGKNSRGEQGPKGEPGYTPQKGVDYFTQEDKDEVVAKVVSKGNTLYANALKGTASGATVLVADVSPLEHSVSVKVSGSDDPTAVTLIKAGLNIWDEQWELGTIYNSGNAAGATDTIRSKNYIPVKAGVKLRFTLPQMARVIYYDTNKTAYNSAYPNPGGSVTPAQDGYIRFAIGGSVGTGNPAITEYGNNICISVFDEATQGVYEPYKGENYVPAEDGTVDGIVGNGEVMTLLTDTSGVVIDCEYNRDTNKAFEQLTQAIISMGGNI